jgi:hypothetical protein
VDRERIKTAHERELSREREKEKYIWCGDEILN